MSSRTRRLVFITALILAVMLPAETILLRALVTPTPQQAVQDWVGALDSAELLTLSSQLQSYPFVYRREVMRRLGSTGRSNVWRAHLQAYLNKHTELDTTAVSLVRTAISLASPEFFEKATEAQRASAGAIAEQMIATIGRDDTEMLLYRLGPPDGTFASFEPLAMRLENTVRGWFIASAFQSDCECSQNAGCFSWFENCEPSSTGCSFVEPWPACGWFWNDTCDGVCRAG